jgi:hypothetical protein
MIYSTKDDFNSENIKILSVDFETRQVTEEDSSNNTIRSQIFAAGFCSNTGFMEAIHLEDSKSNNDEVKFIRYIVYKIQSFQGIITGWYLAKSDLIILDEVCKHIGVVSPVGFYELPLDTASQEHADDEEDNDSETLENTTVKSYPYLKDKKIIDMYKVFHHNFIENSVYPFIYRDLQLDTVASCNRYVGRIWQIYKRINMHQGYRGKCITVSNRRTKDVCLKRCRASYQTHRTK